MRILFVVPRLDMPSTVNRVLLFKPRLESYGAEVTVLRWPEEARAQGDLLALAERCDVVILQKKLLRRSSYWRLRKRARRLIFDFDDAILYRDSSARNPNSITRRWRFRRIIRSVDGVWASNRYLESLALKFTPDAGKIRQIPTVIDLEDWSPRSPEPEPGGPVVLGWMGGEKNLIYLEDLREALEEVGRLRPQAVLRIVSRKFIDLQHLRVEQVPWTPERETEDVKAFDVGLAPLRDDLWTRGKNTLKILNYYGAALPVVASPVGINAEIVQDGVTGFAPQTLEDWVPALCRLIDHPGERERMGLAGRERVRERFSLQAMAPRMWELLVGMAKGEERRAKEEL